MLEEQEQEYDQRWESMDDYEFLCMNTDCDFTTHDKTELKACINCGRVYCDGCLAEIGTEKYCSDCGVCRKCGSEALYFCDNCSVLLCPEDVHEVEYRDDSTGFHDVSLLCLDCKDKR